MSCVGSCAKYIHCLESELKVWSNGGGLDVELDLECNDPALSLKRVKY